jgi:hypothetical protein
MATLLRPVRDIGLALYRGASCGYDLDKAATLVYQMGCDIHELANAQADIIPLF